MLYKPQTSKREQLQRLIVKLMEISEAEQKYMYLNFIKFRFAASDLCDLPLEHGECQLITERSAKRYWFNQVTQQCAEFSYGGCGSDQANRFDTVEECQEICSSG